MADRLQRRPLSLEALLQETAGVDAGALVVFGGVVRARDGDADIAALDYDAHQAMAEKVLQGIEETMESRDGVLACRILHRTGEVPAGEASVYVVVRARHRPEAFKAARDAIDSLKEEAPLWKEDIGPDGSRTPRPPSSGTRLTPSGDENAPADHGGGSPEPGREEP